MVGGDDVCCLVHRVLGLEEPFLRFVDGINGLLTSISVANRPIAADEL
jgi:hypothetical protein